MHINKNIACINNSVKTFAIYWVCLAIVYREHFTALLNKNKGVFTY